MSGRLEGDVPTISLADYYDEVRTVDFFYDYIDGPGWSKAHDAYRKAERLSKLSAEHLAIWTAWSSHRYDRTPAPERPSN